MNSDLQKLDVLDNSTIVISKKINMNKFFLFIPFLIFFGIKMSAQCPFAVTLTSQAEVTDFAQNYPDCAIQGWIETIIIDDITGDIVDLSNLNVIDSIGTRLRIQNTQISSLTSWGNLNSVSTIDISNNQLLTDISGFNKVKSSIEINDNPNLISISGFSSTSKLSGNISLQNNLQLNSITGLSQIKETNGIFLIELGITSLDEFQSLRIIRGTLNLRDNYNLIDVSKLLELDFIWNVHLQGNINLNNCCEIAILLREKIFAGPSTINSNGNTCNSFYEILDLCPDTDKDGILDLQDNCIYSSNSEQEDTDLDGVGDGCDNCPLIANSNQEDINGNGIGDICESSNTANVGIYNEKGDAYISDFTKGIILKSPNGNCFRIRINNNGDLETYEVNCPQ